MMSLSNALLSSTKISVRLSTKDLSAVARLGEIVDFRKNQHIFTSGSDPEALFFIIQGKIIIETEAVEEKTWLGTGDFLGENGFFPGGAESAAARVKTHEATLFRLPRRVLSRPENYETLTKLMTALAPFIQIRKNKRRPDFCASEEFLENHCDHEHPKIVQQAGKLQGSSDWETAVRVWRFVREMPYRFGYWDFPASQTLEIGYGMCTSKANLHAALLRACGLEAAFVELKIRSMCVALLLPEEYRADVREYIKHYFCAVRLENKWFPCDASFTKSSMKLVSTIVPELDEFAEQVFSKNSPYNFAAESEGKDPFDFTPLPDLKKVMRKKPYYDEDNMEAMNIELDKIQNFQHPLPRWALEAEELLDSNPALAFHTALVGISRMLEDEKEIPLTQVDLQPDPIPVPNVRQAEINSRPK